MPAFDFPFLSQSSELPAAVTEFLQPLTESLSTPVSLAILGAGFLGLLFGALIAKTRTSGIEAGTSSDDRETPEVGEEWRWRHEKLVLVERQEAERLARWTDWSEHLFDRERRSDTGLKLRYLHLAESLRALRQRVGADHSRLSLVQAQLTAMADQPSLSRPEIVQTCLGMVGSHVSRLDTLREALRPACLEILSLEEQVRTAETLSTEERKKLADTFTRSRATLASLPHDWHVLTIETDRRIKELLCSGDQGEQRLFAPICDILLLDGAETASLAVRKPISPQRLLRDLAENLDRPQPDARFTVLPKPTPESRSEAAPEPELRSHSDPNPGVASDSLPESPSEPGPPAFAAATVDASAEHPTLSKPTPLPMTPPRPAFGIAAAGHDEPEGATTEAPVAKESESPSEIEFLAGQPEGPADDREILLYRGNDPAIWGRELYQGSRHRARSLDALPSWAKWVSIRRLDTGERVFAPYAAFGRSQAELGGPVGFNASNELFYGARHLGVYAESCPNEVETRFTYGGWGFGHRVDADESSGSEAQACAWAGHEIPSDTVFEIRLHAELPQTGSSDEILDGAATAPRRVAAFG